MRRGDYRALPSAPTSITRARRYGRFTLPIQPEPQARHTLLRCISLASSNHPFRIKSSQAFDWNLLTPTKRASFSTTTTTRQNDRSGQLANYSSLTFDHKKKKGEVSATNAKVMDTRSTSSIQETVATKLAPTKDEVVPPTQSLSRPMTARERMVAFPANVYQFMLDVYRYWDIQACAASPAPNAWQGRIPRQQREQQRLLREGAGIVIPLVVMWIPPIMYVQLLLSLDVTGINL